MNVPTKPIPARAPVQSVGNVFGTGVLVHTNDEVDEAAAAVVVVVVVAPMYGVTEPV